MKKSKKKKKGYLNQKRVKVISFSIIISCIILCIVLSVLMVWELINPKIFWQLLISLGILAIGSALFTVVNGLFRLGK